MRVLVQRAQTGDKDAFTDIVRRTSDDTFALAMRLTSNDHDAADVAQEAYTRAWRSITKFRGDSEFTTWMYRITTNAASTLLSSRQKHRHHNFDDPEVPDPVNHRVEETPDVAVQLQDARERMLEVMEDLSPRVREAVLLRDVADLTHEAIAQQLGITETAAKVRVCRGRQKLQEQFLERGLEPQSLIA